MNLELLDPFQAEFPEIIEDTLVCGVVTCCVFNRRGTLLAVGCHDGRVVIWDFDTRGVARTFAEHIHPVSSITWSKNGRKLLTSSTDWRVIKWDVEKGVSENTFRFESGVLSSCMHPTKTNFFVAFAIQEMPIIGDFSKDPPEKKVLPIAKEEREESARGARIEQQTFCVSFDRKGDKIYVGSWRGVVSIIDFKTLTLQQTINVGNASIKSLQFSKKGDYFMVNSTDRILRVFNVSRQASVEMEFQDPVNKMQWKGCSFSPDADYIIGGSAQKAQHNIYLWNRECGQLIKILEGPKEGIMDLAWHPTRQIIASCSTYGVYIWACNYMYFQTWSAFAPDFTELEENIEYVEREDEFDILEDEKISKKQQMNEEEVVDIMTVDKGFEDDEDDELYYLPTVPEPDPV